LLSIDFNQLTLQNEVAFPEILTTTYQPLWPCFITLHEFLYYPQPAVFGLALYNLVSVLMRCYLGAVSRTVEFHYAGIIKSKIKDSGVAIQQRSKISRSGSLFPGND
jgi:hypothetical protein